MGRITLTKSVSNTISVYYMQTNLLPNSLCERIDKISREDKGIHLIAWDKICKPKNNSSVGIKKAKYMNQSLLMKVGWGLINKRDSLWVRTLRIKYGCGVYLRAFQRLPVETVVQISDKVSIKYGTKY